MIPLMTQIYGKYIVYLILNDANLALVYIQVFLRSSMLDLLFLFVADYNIQLLMEKIDIIVK